MRESNVTAQIWWWGCLMSHWMEGRQPRPARALNLASEQPQGRRFDAPDYSLFQVFPPSALLHISLLLVETTILAGPPTSI